MGLVVQKYGGSSLATPELVKNVAKRIAESHDIHGSLIATVSAMGDTTDYLLKMASEIS